MAAGFVKRPSGTGTAFGHDRNRHRTKGPRTGGTDRRDTGSHDPGPARQKAMSSGERAATGSEGASAPEGSGRTGSRPGSCEPGGPRASAHGPSGGTEASAEDPAGRGITDFGPGNRQGKEEEREFRIRRAANRQGFGPDGEPAGKPEGLRPQGTPEDAGPGPVPVTALEKAHCGRPASAEPDAKGQWGPAAMPGPSTVWGMRLSCPAGRSGAPPACRSGVPSRPHSGAPLRRHSSESRDDGTGVGLGVCVVWQAWINPDSPLPSPHFA